MPAPPKTSAAVSPAELHNLLFVYEAKYAETPVPSALGMMNMAIRLYAAHAGAGEAAINAAEIIAEIGRAERQSRRRKGEAS